MTVSQYQKLTREEVEEVAAELAEFEEYKPTPDEVGAVLAARSAIARFRVHNLIETIRRLRQESDDRDYWLSVR